MSVLAATGPSPLWYLTRGTGLVALVLLTATVVLGVVTTSRWQRPAWPRFATLGLHRNLSLLAVLFLAVHILTAELDTFAPVGWLATVVPFASHYRPLWLGLGTVAFDLFVAVLVTSLLRARIGFRTWRAVHWLAYLSWPVALLHGLGTGTDARLGWVQLLDACCVLAALAAVGWRLAHAPRAQVKTAGGAAVAVTVLAMAVWAFTGPLRPGWAKRAGTPTDLIATSGTAVGTGSGAGGTAGQSPQQPSPPSSPVGGVPDLPFQADLAGTLTKTGPDTAGQVTITVNARLSGSMTGSLILTLRGHAAGTGVSLASSTVTFGPASAPAQYRGQVVVLDGDQVVAEVTNSAGTRLDLGVVLQIDPSRGSVSGTLQANRATRSFGSSDDDPDGSHR